jgi:primosomal protein N' (replication factor Y)
MRKVQILLPLLQMPTLDYLVPDDIELCVGDFVVVPFRRKEVAAIVFSLEDSKEELDPIKLKFVIKKLDLPNLPLKTLEFIKKVAQYTLSPLGSVLKMVLAIDPQENFRVNKKTIAELVDIKLAQLSKSQEQAASYIAEQIDAAKYSVSVIDGVTGSGKTEVYFAAIAKILSKQAGQILIMLPEIVLTSQLMKRFKERFGFTPSQWHSGVSKSDKKRIWHEVLSGKERLVIAARSGLFLPFRELALIIVDEEHEASYKQEDSVIYQARDMAILRAYKEEIPIVLASATPSLETVNNCDSNKYQRIDLISRYGKAVMPEIIIADMRGSLKQKGIYISSIVRQLLVSTLADKKQSMLFLNRRGYAPLTLCKACGYRYICPDCSTWLVEHKSTNRLECHHCGFYLEVKDICPECKEKDSFIACGPGVERIEEEVRTFLPEARIVTMTKDSVSTAKKAEHIVNSILNHEVDIIIGTQVIAKGHHFPILALVGIIDADLGLVGGDLRAAEKSYQLLHQVGGRAGRVGEQGKVVIQTYNPSNAIIQALASQDREQFVEYELSNRHMSNMPPYSRLAAIILSGHDENKVRIMAKEIVRNAPVNKNVTVLGPVPAILARLKRKFRYRILIKANRNFNLQSYLNFWLEGVKKSGAVTVKIDIDPYYFM